MTTFNPYNLKEGDKVELPKTKFGIEVTGNYQLSLDDDSFTYCRYVKKAIEIDEDFLVVKKIETNHIVLGNSTHTGSGGNFFGYDEIKPYILPLIKQIQKELNL